MFWIFWENELTGARVAKTSFRTQLYLCDCIPCLNRLKSSRTFISDLAKFTKFWSGSRSFPAWVRSVIRGATPIIVRGLAVRGAARVLLLGAPARARSGAWSSFWGGVWGVRSGRVKLRILSRMQCTSPCDSMEYQPKPPLRLARARRITSISSHHCELHQ
jgi:hypothetical protein